MKKLILLFTIISSFAFGQVENFSIENKKLFWEKIYESAETKESIEAKLKQSGNFYDIENIDGSLTMKFKDIVPKYREVGQSVGYASMYISSGLFFGSATVEFKDGRYRVILSNIKDKYTLYSMSLNDAESTINIEEVAITRSGDFKSGFAKRDAKVLNYTFNEMFDVSKFKQKTDW